MSSTKVAPQRKSTLSWINLISTTLGKLSDSALFCYGLVFSIQMKVLWQIWLYRDMTGGDTSSYFGDASRWATKLETNIIWSPTYTAFYGTVFAILKNAYDATILHRIIIGVLATLGVLAVSRRMLPSGLALLVAAWWAVLPINFDVYYEVHLFAFLPILAAWLLSMRDDTAWSRGFALSTFILVTILFRNEYFVTCILYGAYCACKEIKMIKISTFAFFSTLLTILPKYVIPLALSLIVCLFFYLRTPFSNDTILEQLQTKHTLNMCQVYAFGFGQRHSEWAASPWTECQGLMVTTFGTELPTLSQMLYSNFSAVKEHFFWNLSLTGSGLQISLFNAAFGKINPDYTPRNLQEIYPLWLSILAGGIFGFGTVMVFRDWRRQWSVRFSTELFRWIPLLAVAVVSVPVILTQRPRPEYLYGLTFTIMILIGTSVHILMQRWARIVQVVSLIVGLTMLLLVPPYYPAHTNARPAKVAYDRLVPYRSLLDELPGKIILGDYAYEMVNWLSLSKHRQTVVNYGTIAGWSPDMNLCSKVDCTSVSALYIYPFFMSQVKKRIAEHTFCPKDPDGRPWFAIGTDAENENSLLLVRKTDDTRFPKDMVATECGNLGFELAPSGVRNFPSGLMAPGLFFSGVTQDGWLGTVATTKLALPGVSNLLHVTGEIPNFGGSILNGTIRITVDDKLVFDGIIPAGSLDRTFPIPDANGTRMIRLEMGGTGQLAPPDSRFASIQLTSIILDRSD